MARLNMKKKSMGAMGMGRKDGKLKKNKLCEKGGKKKLTKASGGAKAWDGLTEESEGLARKWREKKTKKRDPRQW